MIHQTLHTPPITPEELCRPETRLEALKGVKSAPSSGGAYLLILLTGTALVRTLVTKGLERGYLVS